MRTIRPVAALASLLVVCALTRAAEPLPTPAPGMRQPTLKPALTVEQQLGNLQQQVATLQAQVAELRSVLQVSQSGVLLKGNVVSIEALQDLNLRSQRHLNADAGFNARLKASGQITIEAAGTLVLKGSTIQQN